MNTGLLLVTHKGIGSALLTQARRILDDPMAGMRAFEVSDAESGLQDALAQTVAAADEGAGVLLLTDLPGATPANLAQALGSPSVRVVSGLNLPMLIRAWNYRDRPLDALSALAVEGARSAAIELA